MSEQISEVFRWIVLLRSQSDQAIPVQKYSHWVYHGSHQHVYAKVILVALPQCGSVQVLLYHVACLTLVKLLLFVLLWL